ncbi:UvrABC system protein A, partial [Haemophilus influenzae]
KKFLKKSASVCSF